jgi:hypothetical protein
MSFEIFFQTYTEILYYNVELFTLELNRRSRLNMVYTYCDRRSNNPLEIPVTHVFKANKNADYKRMCCLYLT